VLGVCLSSIFSPHSISFCFFFCLSVSFLYCCQGPVSTLHTMASWESASMKTDPLSDMIVRFLCRDFFGHEMIR